MENNGNDSLYLSAICNGNHGGSLASQAYLFGHTVYVDVSRTRDNGNTTVLLCVSLPQSSVRYKSK